MTRITTLLAALVLVVSACGAPDATDGQNKTSAEQPALSTDPERSPAPEDPSTERRCRTRCGNKICPIGMRCYVRCCTYTGEDCSGGDIVGRCWNADADNHGLCGRVRSCG